MTPEHFEARSAQKSKKKARPKDPAKVIPAEEPVEVLDDQSAVLPELAPATAERGSYEMGEEYLWQIYFDKASNKYIGTVLEFPEVKAEGIAKDKVMQELSHQVQQKLVAFRMNGERAPEPILNKSYPDKLVVSVSQSLYRKLDIYSRQERVGLEQLVGEVLSSLVERRGSSRSSQQQGQSSSQHDRGDRGQQRYQGQGHRHQQQRSRGGYNQGMENGDNFLEYVRNLEKRGGSAGKYRR